MFLPRALLPESLATRGLSRPGGFTPCRRHDLEKVAVGIEEVETFVIAPVHRPMGRDAGSLEGLLRHGEILQFHEKGVLVQRILYFALGR